MINSESTMAATPTPSSLPAAPAALRSALLDWYDRHGRRLPWRALPGAGIDPYAVLVSEVMLQQTTVATVRARFGPFLQRFPSLEALARAPLEDVLHAWQGLGYYRRARTLHACAQAVVAGGGSLPEGLAALRALPGLGDYTAAALAAIAFGHGIMPIDGNVTRVLARLAAIDGPPAATRRAVAGVAGDMAAPHRASDLAQALMDLGATICTPRKPACPLCPWAGPCVARKLDSADSIPRAAERRARPIRQGVAFVLRRGDGAVLFRRRPLRGLLAGMIELPSTPWDRPEPTAEPMVHAPAAFPWHRLDGEVRHIFTHFELRLTVRTAHGELRDGLWAAPGAFGALALPTLTTRLLAHAGLLPGHHRRHASGR